RPRARLDGSRGHRPRGAQRRKAGAVGDRGIRRHHRRTARRERGARPPRQHRDSRMNPFLLEIVKNALETIADELALIIMRTAYSSIVRDAMDFSTAICDREGRTLAQGLTTPLHLGSFFAAMQNLLAVAARGGGAKAGDVYIFNDPYLAAGQHLPDIYIVKPIFIGGELEGWATT